MAIGLSFDEISKLALERANVSVDPLPTPPAAPDNFTVTARNLGFLLQWSRVSGVDGYQIVVSANEDRSSPITILNAPGENNNEYFYSTGHVAVTRHFWIQSYKGSSFSEFTSPSSGTTPQSEAQFSFPNNTTFNGTETTLATINLTSNGGTVRVDGGVVTGVPGGVGAKTITVRIRRDGTEIRSLNGAAPDDAAGDANQYILMAYESLAAGTYAYTLTARNTTDNSTINAGSIQLLGAEIPLLLEAASASPPTPPPTPPNPQTYPTGPEMPYPRY
jgi:hypothetical protein